MVVWSMSRAEVDKEIGGLLKINKYTIYNVDN